MENYDINNLPKELFEVAPEEGRLHDKKLETKPIGYFKDAFIRFRKNKASIVAAIIVIILVLFSLVGPYCFNQDYIKAYQSDIDLTRYQYLPPRLGFMDGSGIWDGSKVEEISEAKRYKYISMAIERGEDQNPLLKDIKSTETFDGTSYKTLYKVRSNKYYTLDVFTKTYTQEEYFALQEWQNENNIQIILPWVDIQDKNSGVSYIKDSPVKFNNLNYWFACDSTGYPVLDENGDLIPAYRTAGPKDSYESLRLPADPGNDPESTVKWKYASVSGSKKNGYSYTVRINPYTYFEYKYGFEPSFAFGADAQGYDIFTRLAKGARFSMLFALAISAINLFIGAIYGAIEGYYGGIVDLAMERLSDLLSAIPMMVVTVLFNLHLSGKVGTIPALLFSFVLTGWIGMASSTRMQFYRFKNQEYVLAARTLGAKDWRIMFKHVFPNSLGTLITGSVLSIPGVIFSETSLTYLGIINLDSPTRSSVGAMLSNGQGVMTQYPHMVLWPAMFIGLLMVSFNLFGNGLRDAFNPSLRGAED